MTLDLLLDRTFPGLNSRPPIASTTATAVATAEIDCDSLMPRQTWCGGIYLICLNRRGVDQSSSSNACDGGRLPSALI